VRAALLLLVGLAVGTGCRASYTGSARPVAASDALAGYVRAAPTPVVRQRDRTDCGLAALAMMAGAWGRTWTVVDLAKHAAPTDRGIQLGALRDLARKRGLDAYAIKATTSDLERELTAGRPVLVGLVLPYEGNHFLGHYEVAVAMDPARGDVITQDPATGKTMRRSRVALEQEWARASHATLVVVGPLARSMLNPTTEETP